ncbi:MAG: cysteine synthase [Chloroflexi bacterium]|nr:MAG: cysteine synthase [Chloroflexota bacterium]
MPAAIRDSVLQTIGNTPCVRLRRIVPPGSADVLVKLEYFNPTGSYKDRMALALIEAAEQRGALRPGMRVVEFSGGSTGSSLALVCALKGYPLRIISSDAFAREKLATIRAFGADVELIPSAGGKITPDLMGRMRARVLELAADPEVYWTDQFHNADAETGYVVLGRELVEQTGGRIDAFCGGIGTAGMLTGAGAGLRNALPNIQIVSLEPATSAVVAGGTPGAHRVEGVGMGIVPPLLDRSLLSSSRGIAEDVARATARELARREGIFAGISSGMNVAGALELQQELGPGHTVATVAVDTGLKYLAGDLFEG